MTPYPADLPVSDIQLIVSDIRNGTLARDRVAFAHAIWELSGYALKSAFGDPAPVAGFQSSAPLTNEQVADHLSDLLCHNEKGICCTALPIPWLAIAKWALQLLLELL